MARSFDQNLPDVAKFVDDPNRSYTLPGSFYYDPDIYAKEQVLIFNRSWQYVCHVSKLQKTGDYCVRDIGDQSVVVLRDATGNVQAFHNVCQHRAHRLVEGAGCVGNGITCPYHNWSYQLTGELRHAPQSERVVEFKKTDICLSGVRVETFCGFVFVNLDASAQPLIDGLEHLEKEIRGLSPNIEFLVLSRERQIPINANWKNSVENYSECYHCPNQPPTLSQGSLDLSSYQITVHNKFHSHASNGVGESTMYFKKAAVEDEREFGSWLLWPNFVLEVYPGGYLNVFHHLPAGTEKTIQLVEWYFPTEEPTAEQLEVVDFVDVVRDADIPLCESVQKGLHSLGYSQGRFVANEQREFFSEHAVHDFQRKVLATLNKTD